LPIHPADGRWLQELKGVVIKVHLVVFFINFGISDLVHLLTTPAAGRESQLKVKGFHNATMTGKPSKSHNGHSTEKQTDRQTTTIA